MVSATLVDTCEKLENSFEGEKIARLGLLWPLLFSDPWIVFCHAQGFGYWQLAFTAARLVLQLGNGYSIDQRRAACQVLPKPLLGDERMYARGLSDV